jgi:hypothetical protein
MLEDLSCWPVLLPPPPVLRPPSDVSAAPRAA